MLVILSDLRGTTAEEKIELPERGSSLGRPRQLAAG
jgi:hypothetical protein